MKGKIDVTVDVVSRGEKRQVPLELKTGRPSYSAEHKGQVQAIASITILSPLILSYSNNILLVKPMVDIHIHINLWLNLKQWFIGLNSLTLRVTSSYF